MIKENKILISILIPTYNRRKYLEECLNSVVEQEGFKKEEIEILIGDNSEGNETKEFMDKFLKLNHKYNIKYIKNKKNMGSNRNINNLLDESHGKYYIILSDDDKFYDSKSLISIYNGLNEYNLDVCYGKYMVFNSDGSKFWDYKPHKKIKDKKIYFDSFDEQILYHTMTYGGVLYKQFGYRYDEKSKWFCDWNMNLRYLYENKKAGMINKYTFLYRRHDTNDGFNVPKIFFFKFIFYTYRYFKIPWNKGIRYFFNTIKKIIISKLDIQ